MCENSRCRFGTEHALEARADESHTHQALVSELRIGNMHHAT